ncbi:hypothetical protein [Streptomyces sp. LBL]|uniref:hypothetical protein n=1 Tax=Streptomyces sp. LBL TaxID=2940562 RepID=UPI0024769D6A|nr:hypothetical protein [Streptomyces sp. LBL]
MCACAAVSGARSIDELAEWGQRASNALLTVIGIRRHLLGWRRSPAPATIGVCWGLLTVTPWTGRSAPTSPTGTAPPPTPPRPGRPPRPGCRARSLSTAKHSRDQPVLPRRAGICSPRSLTAPS